MKVLHKIKPEKVFLIEMKSGLKAIKKVCLENEYKYFLEISRKYYRESEYFKHLYIPNILVANPNEKIIIMEYIQGQHFEWSEHEDNPGYGGNKIDCSEIENILLAIKELQILKPNFHTGDFQFRNMIKKNDGKIAIFDFEGAIENIFGSEYDVAYLYLMLWNNKQAQKELIKVAHELNMIQHRSFKACLTILSNNQSLFWRDHKNLKDEMEKILISSIHSFGAIWEGEF